MRVSRAGVGQTVATAEIEAGAVTAAKLATDAVETAKIKDSNVTTAKINNSAVTLAKLAGGTAAKVIGFDSAGDPEESSLGRLELLAFHEAATTESSYVYTPSASLNADDYSAWKVYFHGHTSDSLELRLRWNNLSNSEYQNIGIRYNGSAVTNITAGSNTAMLVADATTIPIARQVWATAELYINDIPGTKSFAQSKAYSYSQITQDMQCYHTSNAAALSKIEVMTSTSTWVAGTKIAVYGVRK